MLEDRPILKDRLTAGAVFSGIAIAAVAGFELIITGGFDVFTPSFGQRDRTAPYEHSAVMTPWVSDAYAVTPTSLSDSLSLLSVEPEAHTSGDDLVGAEDGSFAVEEDAIPSEAELDAEIDALYEQSAAYAEEAFVSEPPAPDKVY